MISIGFPRIALVPALTAASVAGVLSFAILFVLLRTGWAWRLAVDVPNHRSLHVRPVPRVGGWGVVPVVAAIVAIAAHSLCWIAMAVVVLASISYVDDRHGLSAKVRFGVHVAVSVAFLMLYVPSAPWWFTIICVVALVWSINLYNFMDGADGLAGGVALVGFTAYAIRAVALDQEVAIAAAAVAGATAGFLILNFHPAKVFLGDIGSVPLGFLAGAIGMTGWMRHVWPLSFPVMVFAPFLADATVTLLRRLLRGQKFWQAHREHYYQRAVQMGATHRVVAVAYYLLTAISSIAAVCFLEMNAVVQWVSVFSWYALLGIIGWYIDRRWWRFNGFARNDSI